MFSRHTCVCGGGQSPYVSVQAELRPPLAPFSQLIVTGSSAVNRLKAWSKFGAVPRDVAGGHLLLQVVGEEPQDVREHLVAVVLAVVTVGGEHLPLEVGR